NSTKNLASKKLLRDRWEWHIGLLRLNLETSLQDGRNWRKAEDRSRPEGDIEMRNRSARIP
ncbi:hypothetical protein, partial [Agrobacterium tumefaciens]|uniref:hypothetical protein n=1 Tax=Agrobacterium tumefaciens TaxID=358 RepID=UPI003B9FC51F